MWRQFQGKQFHSCFQDLRQSVMLKVRCGGSKPVDSRHLLWFAAKRIACCVVKPLNVGRLYRPIHSRIHLLLSAATSWVNTSRVSCSPAHFGMDQQLCSFSLSVLWADLDLIKSNRFQGSFKTEIKTAQVVEPIIIDFFPLSLISVEHLFRVFHVTPLWSISTQSTRRITNNTPVLVDLNSRFSLFNDSCAERCKTSEERRVIQFSIKLSLLDTLNKKGTTERKKKNLKEQKKNKKTSHQARSRLQLGAIRLFKDSLLFMKWSLSWFKLSVFCLRDLKEHSRYLIKGIGKKKNNKKKQGQWSLEQPPINNLPTPQYCAACTLSAANANTRWGRGDLYANLCLTCCDCIWWILCFTKVFFQ